jgi:hypothetical protein
MVPDGRGPATARKDYRSTIDAPGTSDPNAVGCSRMKRARAFGVLQGEPLGIEGLPGGIVGALTRRLYPAVLGDPTG